MKHVIALLVCSVLVVAGCRVSDVREMTVNVPGMVEASDVEKVRAALVPLGGVNKEETVYDAKTRTVTVKYDSMVIAHKNIEIAIAEAGYDANNIPAIKKVVPAK